jgi:hypothetical protein
MMAPIMRTSVDADVLSDEDGAKVYSLCLYDASQVVPIVMLVDARDDAEAISIARSRVSLGTKEIWDRHRLVARIPPTP